MMSLSNQEQINRTERASTLTVFFFLFIFLLYLIGVRFAFFKEQEVIAQGKTSSQITETSEGSNSLSLEESAISDKKKVEESETGINLIPTKISAPSIGLETDVIFPDSTEISVLDNALLDGVVYYPDSGYLGKNSNIFLFGHSSFLPIVRNQNFRIFNGIKDLKVGDIVTLEKDNESFEYRVISNRLVKDHEVRIEFSADEPKLTLATCHSFGEKEDRYLVEAILIQ